jgi:hypothetical protein
MKKLLPTILIIASSIIGYSQNNSGTITGYFNLSLGQKAIYTAGANAQCGNCYDWDINNDFADTSDSFGTIKINGSDMGKTIEIEAVTVGEFKLDLSYIDETGLHTQSFIGNVIHSNESCDYNFAISDQYKDIIDVKNADNVLLSIDSNYPAGTQYTWTVYRQDGTFLDYASLSDKTIILNASANNRIIRTTVTAEYLNCTKTVTKKFIHAIPIIDQLGNLFPECMNPLIDNSLLVKQTNAKEIKNKATQLVDNNIKNNK